MCAEIWHWNLKRGFFIVMFDYFLFCFLEQNICW